MDNQQPSPRIRLTGKGYKLAPPSNELGQFIPKYGTREVSVSGSPMPGENVKITGRADVEHLDDGTSAIYIDARREG